MVAVRSSRVRLAALRKSMLCGVNLPEGTILQNVAYKESAPLLLWGTYVSYCALGHRAYHIWVWKKLTANKSAHEPARLPTENHLHPVPAPRSR